jgi:hypothetical protein
MIIENAFCRSPEPLLGVLIGSEGPDSGERVKTSHKRFL